MKYVGTEVAGLNSRRLVAGHGRYTGDIYLDGMLSIAFLRSPHAHARIGKIDKREASAVPGVVYVLTAEEINQQLGPLTHTIDPESMCAKRGRSMRCRLKTSGSLASQWQWWRRRTNIPPAKLPI